jgi:hypothetical protein
MELEKLNKEELVKLKEDIDNRLKTIEVKKIKPKKSTLMSLKKGDKILGIKLSFGGHRLAEPNELNGSVDVVGYCDITEVDLSDSDYFTINISHPEHNFGVYTNLSKEIYVDEHCYLDINTFKTGYNGFYTLKPENWEKDLKRMVDRRIKFTEEDYQKNIKLFNDKFKLFIDSEEKINSFI